MTIRSLRATLLGSGLLLLLAGCAGPTGPAPATSSGSKPDTGLDRLERLALSANRCWFKSNDPAFSRYSLAPELSSFSGRPRFLVVPKGRLEDRPLLVVEGRSGSSEIETYGPLLQGETGARIERDIARWSAGARDCAAAS